MNYSKEQLLIVTKSLDAFSNREWIKHKLYKKIWHDNEKEQNAYCIWFEDCLDLFKEILSLNNEDEI
jgi:hypothetical protein